MYLRPVAHLSDVFLQPCVFYCPSLFRDSKYSVHVCSFCHIFKWTVTQKSACPWQRSSHWPSISYRLTGIFRLFQQFCPGVTPEKITAAVCLTAQDRDKTFLCVLVAFKPLLLQSSFYCMSENISLLLNSKRTLNYSCYSPRCQDPARQF